MNARQSPTPLRLSVIYSFIIPVMTVFVRRQPPASTWKSQYCKLILPKDTLLQGLTVWKWKNMWKVGHYFNNAQYCIIDFFIYIYDTFFTICHHYSAPWKAPSIEPTAEHQVFHMTTAARHWNKGRWHMAASYHCTTVKPLNHELSLPQSSTGDDIRQPRDRFHKTAHQTFVKFYIEQNADYKYLLRSSTNAGRWDELYYFNCCCTYLQLYIVHYILSILWCFTHVIFYHSTAKLI